MAALRWSSRASTICTESRQTPASQAAEDADCSGANPLSANPCRRVRRRCVRFGMSNEFCHSEPQARNLRRKRRARRQVGAIHELPLQCYQAYALDSSSRHVRARNDRAGCWLHLMNILDDSRSTPPLTGFSTSAKVMSDPYPGGMGLTIAEGSPES